MLVDVSCGISAAIPSAGLARCFKDRGCGLEVPRAGTVVARLYPPKFEPKPIGLPCCRCLTSGRLIWRVLLQRADVRRGFPGGGLCCGGMWSQQKSDDLMAQMDNIDEEIAEPFKEALKSELRKYVDSRYADQGGMSTGAASYTLYSSKGQEVGGDIELTMIVAARRARPRGLWSGTWTSQWRTLFEPGQAEPVKMVGILEFISHYAEDGNVHFRRRAESRSSVSETTDPTKFAVEVVKAIRKEEDSFQASTEDQCDSLCDGTLRALRRTLPVSKERFDWRPSRHALVRDLKAAGKDGGS
eukprot:s687_g14.t1